MAYTLAHSLVLQIVEEAGGAVSRMDGGKFCVFDRSVLVSNGSLHRKVSSVSLFFSCLIPVAFLNEVQRIYVHDERLSLCE